MKLAEIQSEFLRLASTEAGDPAALLGPITRGASARRRLQLYREASFMKCAEGLRLSYPMTAALLGPEEFFGRIRPYVETPTEGRQTRARLAAGLPEFLRGQGLDGRPDLADLAQLERARSQVAEEPSVEPMSLERVAPWPPDLPAVRLRFVPALRVIALGFDVFDLWSSLESGLAPPPPRPKPSTFLVWRSGLRVFHSSLGDHEAEALQRALAGASLAEVCACFLTHQDASGSAHGALHAWFGDGLVASVEHVPSA